MAAVPSLAELMHHGLGLRDHAAEESPHPLSFWVPPCGLADDVPEVSSGAPPVGDEACGDHFQVRHEFGLQFGQCIWG